MKATMTVKAGIETYNIRFDEKLSKWVLTDADRYGFCHEKLSYLLCYIEEKTGYKI